MRQYNLSLAWIIGLTVFTGLVFSQPQPPGAGLFQKNCASCHSAEGGAPTIAALNAMPTESIFDALMKGKMKEKWGKLSDDDLNVIDGRRDQLEGKIQERYGIVEDQAKKDVDAWCNSIKW